jgi:apolipoprotein N-acyltransferase
VVRARTDLGRRQVLTDTVQRRTGDTIYTRLGDGPFVFLTLLVLVVAWGFAIRASRRADPLRAFLRRP